MGRGLVFDENLDISRHIVGWPEPRRECNIHYHAVDLVR